jgi:hypothetical protein
LALSLFWTRSVTIAVTSVTGRVRRDLLAEHARRPLSMLRRREARADFLEVEFALDGAQDRVLDSAEAMQTDQLRPAGGDGR